VSASGGVISVVAGGATLVSSDAGRSFAPGSAPPPPAADGCQGHARGNQEIWEICSGRVRHGRVGGPAPAPDPGSPDLGAGAHLIAAPGAYDGKVVVAVAGDGTVWRRTAAGSWGRGLILLPESLLHGAPAVTALAAFAEPLSTAVYLGTDGYSVLLTTSGGDSWVRAGPALPDGVLALQTDASTRALYAGTRDGLWVHHLQATPAPPSYPPQDLRLRWLGTALVTLAGSGLALLLLLRFARA
jgi:hypothetical protein